MSVRKRNWVTTDTRHHHAWIVDYRDHDFKRRMRTFKERDEAVRFHNLVSVSPSVTRRALMRIAGQLSTADLKMLIRRKKGAVQQQ